MTDYPNTLRALKLAADEAWAAYYAQGLNNVQQDMDRAILADLTARRLLKAYAAAKAAYDQAADEYLAGTGLCK